MAASLSLAAADQKQEAREIYKELIEINTTDSVGDNTAAAQTVARRLLQAGFPEADVKVLAPHPKKGNLVARLRGTGTQKPILFLSHLDVVEARREDWSMDPFQLTERDGYFYGRGTEDVKNGATYLLENFLRLKREGFRPDRDYILAVTADEEGGDYNGVSWLLDKHRELIDAAFCVNTDGGGGQLLEGKPTVFGLQAAEKLFTSYTLQATNPGGHSSRPRPDNAIYQLANGLTKLENYKFPIKLSEITRGYFSREAKFHDATEAADMRALAAGSASPDAIARLEKSAYFNAQMRTTCIPTLLQAGHAENALPQTAVATVNCRILPGDSAEEILSALKMVTSGTGVTVTRKTEVRSTVPSPLKPALMSVVEKIVSEMWPTATVVPIMDTGASDGRQLRSAGIPTYGVDPTFIEKDEGRAHGRDERIPVKSFYDGVEFYYRLMKALGTAKID
jgi:acetylornithine deacetylase/succinyl-diaminopimelate desuccinylase-like protein